MVPMATMSPMVTMNSIATMTPMATMVKMDQMSKVATPTLTLMHNGDNGDSKETMIIGFYNSVANGHNNANGDNIVKIIPMATVAKKR